MAATLLIAASVEQQWRDVAAPWLRAQAAVAWTNPLPTVVLTPSRAESFYLRGRMLAEGIPNLGLRFWTPSDLRKFLHFSYAIKTKFATQANLRLLARFCAERLLASAGAETGPNASLESVGRDPAAFLRAYDLLLGAGWDPVHDGSIYGRRLAGDFQGALNRFGIATQAGIHSELRRVAADGEEKPLGQLLIVGFNATHWPLWDLLKAAFLSAQNAWVALSDPRYFGAEADGLWINSWEEFAQRDGIRPSNPDGVETPAPLAKLVATYERGAVPSAQMNASDLTLLVTPDLTSQIRAVVLQALVYLKNSACDRLGIVFPSANALALGVAAELGRLGIPIDDGTGSLMPGPFEQRSWQSWLALQEEPGLPRLIAWLRACEAEGVSCGADASLSARDVANLLVEELKKTLIDDLNFLARHLEEASNHSLAPAMARFLRERIALPEAASFAQFLELTRAMLELPGWEKQRDRIESEPPSWLLDPRVMISRRTYLEWLRDATRSQARTRGPEANHFYGKVHLVLYAQMTGQTWSHLILTGLNEGTWPRFDEAGAFGSRHELDELNRRMRDLNPRGERQGGQGEGHNIVGSGHGHCLLPLERRDLALRDLCAALESTRVAATLTALTSEGGKSLLPSDFFNHAYQFTTGRAANDDELGALAEATCEWCRQHDALLRRGRTLESARGLDDLPLLAEAKVQATRQAYLARRDAGRPFGRHEFAYAQPPLQPIQLTCTEWERAWKHPATEWLSRVVGAEPWPDGAASWSNAIGIRVHRALAAGLDEWGESERKRSGAELAVLVWDAAERATEAIRTCAEHESVELHPWWGHVWQEAKTRALQLGEKLAVLLPGHAFRSEFVLPPNLRVALPGRSEADFRLKGRLDFLRIEGQGEDEPGASAVVGRSCWVIDFKTGSAAALTPKNIAKGAGLQAVLYGWAIQAMGATRVTVSLLTPESAAKDPLEVGAVLEPVLRSLDTLHRRGVFGMRPDADAEYGHAPDYPLATLSIPPSVLEAKWVLTHGPSGEEYS